MSDKYIATVCFFIKDSQVLLAEFQYPDGKKLWNGIGGKVDEGETPLEAVVREIGEETNIKVDVLDLHEMDVITNDNFELHVFVTSQWSGEITAIDPTLKQFKWFRVDEVPYAVMHEGNDRWLPKVLSLTI